METPDAVTCVGKARSVCDPCPWKRTACLREACVWPRLGPGPLPSLCQRSGFSRWCSACRRRPVFLGSQCPHRKPSLSPGKASGVEATGGPDSRLPGKV